MSWPKATFIKSPFLISTSPKRQKKGAASERIFGFGTRSTQTIDPSANSWARLAQLPQNFLEPGCHF